MCADPTCARGWGRAHSCHAARRRSGGVARRCAGCRVERSLLDVPCFTSNNSRSEVMESVTVFRSQPRSEMAPANLARGLGWFSLALGLTEIATPDMLSKAIGIPPKPSTSWLMRAMGVRELLAGAGVLMQPRRSVPLWMRVAGDAVDLALLAVASRARRGNGARIAGAIAAVAGVTALDVIAARRAQQASEKVRQPAIFSVTI